MVRVRAHGTGREPGPLEPVGPLLRNALRRLGLDRRMAEQRAVEAWPVVVGPAIAAHTRAAGMREGVLFVEVESSVWMQELGLLRDGIAARLNAHLGATHVQRIVLSIDREPLAAAGGTPEGEVEGPHGQ